MPRPRPQSSSAPRVRDADEAQRARSPPYNAVISYSKTTRTILLDSKLVTRTAYQPVLKRAATG